MDRLGEVGRLWDAGSTPVQIAGKLGLSRQRVDQLLRKVGVPAGAGVERRRAALEATKAAKERAKEARARERERVKVARRTTGTCPRGHPREQFGYLAQGKVLRCRQCAKDANARWRRNNANKWKAINRRPRGKSQAKRRQARSVGT